jgi:uncharacterized protein with HEPN domain
LIQVIGEAARRISADFQKAHSQIPWAQIAGMRHKVVHDYLQVDYDIVWGVASVHLAPLIADLEKISPPASS